MKHKIFILSLFFLLGLLLINIEPVKAFTDTGHEDFPVISLPKSVKLLNEYSVVDLDKAYKKVKWNFFGWDTEYFHYEIPITYDGKDIFSRSNKTTQAIKVDYSVRGVEVTSSSVKVKGSVSSKITGKIKKISTDIVLEGDFAGERSESNEFEKETKTSFSMIINPFYKITLLTTGKARLTNGVSIYRFLGIPFSKGGWERIDVETIYYELREEKV